jgi:hypothetical protein
MQMLDDGRLSKKPMFHLDYFQTPSRPKHLKSIPLDSFSSDDATTTILFKAPKMRSDDMTRYRKLASECIEEAVKSTGTKGVSKFSLVINKSDGLEIESCDFGAPEMDKFKGDEVKLAKWEELGLENFALMKENKPVLVSYRFVSSEVDEALVVMMQSNHQENDDTEVFIGTTIPKN